ncbi:MAG: hypothetical protein K0S33_2549 [Bacteroidetes bacterium]|jgi:outer membrane protein assembly factor BamE (lipoprotein component of BamABCDE complex)|nr:hypothetical protein [Bacteroidota bacterium]
MKFYQRIVAVISTSLIAFVLFSFGQAPLMEGYNPVKPDVDTQYSEKFDEAKFRTIQNGMDTAEVISLIGMPMSRQRLGDTMTLWYYTCDGKCEWADFAWLGRVIYVAESGRVSSTAMPVCHD